MHEDQADRTQAPHETKQKGDLYLGGHQGVSVLLTCRSTVPCMILLEAHVRTMVVPRVWTVSGDDLTLTETVLSEVTH